MMARILCTVLVTAAVLGIRFPAYAQLDTSVTNSLGKKLDQYMALLEMEPVRVKCEEADFLIGSCTDSLVKQFTAIRLYSHFMDSKLMGDEAVSIHIFDKWFAPGTVKMQSELEFMNARIFAEFNRQSLIGNKAPELYLEDISGAYVSLFGDGKRNDRPSILFFYDNGCATCTMESIMLRSLLNGTEYPVDLYAVYTGQSREGMEEFISGYLCISNPQVRVRYLWDPMSVSDFQMKYGILQTPGIFLVTRDGTIAGRKLDVRALERLMKIHCKPYEYGGPESSAFYDEVFAVYAGHPGCDDVKSICDAIAAKTLEKKDTLRFRQMTGDLMYWLGASRGEGVKCGLDYLIDRYIDGEPAVWTSSEDSLKILSYSEILGDLSGMAPVGERLPAIKVTGVMKHGENEKVKAIRLDRLRGTTLIFHTEGCGFCAAELAAADSLASADRKSRFFLVDIDEVMNTDPDTAYALFGKFDLTVMPYITVTDRKGLVIRKYVSLTL